MAFPRSQHIANLLLGGNITSVQLESAITTNDSFNGAWKRLLRSGTIKSLIANTTAFGIIAGSATAFGDLLTIAGTQLAASDSATTAISNDSNAIKTVVTSATHLNLWNNVPANKTRLQARINASGSKLKRQVWKTSGTWTAPVTPIVALSVFAIGGGGNGGNGGWDGGSTRGEAGSGGSGAEASTKSATTSLPTTNQTVTVGSAAAASSFGSFLTAAAGVSGSKGGSTTSGGGSDVSSIYDSDLENAIYQPTTASKQGGNGANGGLSSGNVNGSAGIGGLSGSGGIAGTQNGSSCTNAGAGAGLTSGGGSGAIIYPGGASAANGADATNIADQYGCGGGGGSGTAGASSGGVGAPGAVVAYWVEG